MAGTLSQVLANVKNAVMPDRLKTGSLVKVHGPSNVVVYAGSSTKDPTLWLEDGCPAVVINVFYEKVVTTGHTTKFFTLLTSRGVVTTTRWHVRPQ